MMKEQQNAVFTLKKAAYWVWKTISQKYKYRYVMSLATKIVLSAKALLFQTQHTITTVIVIRKVSTF